MPRSPCAKATSKPFWPNVKRLSQRWTARFPGLILAWLTQRDGGSWLDVVLWRSREQAEHAAAHVTEVPEAAAWFTHIDQFRGVEHVDVRSPKD